MRFVRPDVQFQIEDGPAYTARMSVEGWAALQEHWDLSNLDATVQRLGEVEGGKFPVSDISSILWAMLRTHHPEVTLEEARRMADDMGIPNFLSLTGRCAAASLPDGEGGGKAPANPLRRWWSRGRSTASMS